MNTKTSNMYKSAPDDTLVYVIELEQPWQNWTGVLLEYNTATDLCTVERDEDEVVIVPLRQVYDADTDTPIIEILNILQ